MGTIEETQSLPSSSFVPLFDRSYWTHNRPKNQTHADTGVRQNSSDANWSLVVERDCVGWCLRY